MKRLTEWNSKKSAILLKKLLTALTKRTGERYFLIGIPKAYKNQWGKFLGYYVVSSKRKVFRFNIQLEKVDQAKFASVDRFKTGFEPKPLSTLSFEGFNIMQVFPYLIDFAKLLNPLDAFKQVGEAVSPRKREAVWTPQPATNAKGQANLSGLIANFLGENRNWVQAVNAGGFDSGKLIKDLRRYLHTAMPGIFNYSSSRLLQVMQVVIASFDDFGGTNASAHVPVAKVFKPSGADIQIPLAPAAPLSAAAQEINDMFTAQKTPDEVYEEFMDDIRRMLNQKTPWSGVIAYGPGGTGKTYHAEKVAREEGLSEGVGCITIGTKFQSAEEIMKMLYENREVSLVIIDDADSILSSPDRENILKHALDSANPYVQFQKPMKLGNDEAIEPGKYTIESKFVINTNMSLDDIGKSDAILSRCKAHNFDFTNEQMKELLKSRFFALAQDIDTDGSDQVDQGDCDFILNIFQSLIDGRKLNRFSFRLMKNVLFDYILAKTQNLDKTKAVIRAIKASPTR